MIEIRNIENVKETDNFDFVFAIVRKIKDCPPWMIQLSALSPVEELLNHYIYLRDAEKWNEETFQKEYVPAFMKQILENVQNIKEHLSKLRDWDKEGKNICLVCFCEDETICHRSIIAGILQGMGCHVRTETGRDYSHYFV